MNILIYITLQLGIITLLVNPMDSLLLSTLNIIGVYLLYQKIRPLIINHIRDQKNFEKYVNIVYRNNRNMFVNLNNEHQMFDGWTDDIAVALSHKPQDFHVCNGNTILSSGIKSTTLIVTQGKAEYKKNLDDVAIAPFLKGVELSGYEWRVESDLSCRSFVISG